MILEPGSFRVADYRKSMSWRVKCEALMWYYRDLIDYARANGYQKSLPPNISTLPLAEVEFDHRPPLYVRPYDTEAGDFIPRQNDPQYIVPCAKRDHLEKTTGRKADAERTVSTAGSDMGNRRKTSDIRAAEAFHKVALAVKAGDHQRAAIILSTANLKKKHTRPKQRIKQRATPWPKRKFGV